MRALVQRVEGASVSVDGHMVGELRGLGLLVLVGVTHTDDAATAKALARKVYGLRIFDGPDRDGPREVSAADLGLGCLVVSQFTLYGSTSKGRRPTWDAAAGRAVAEPLVVEFADALAEQGAEVAQGRFGADMRVSSVNVGPMTLMVEA